MSVGHMLYDRLILLATRSYVFRIQMRQGTIYALKASPACESLFAWILNVDDNGNELIAPFCTAIEIESWSCLHDENSPRSVFV